MQKKNFKFIYLALAMIGLTAQGSGVSPTEVRAFHNQIGATMFNCNVMTSDARSTNFSVKGGEIDTLGAARAMLQKKARIQGGRISLNSMPANTAVEWHAALKKIVDVDKTNELIIYVAY